MTGLVRQRMTVQIQDNALSSGDRQILASLTLQGERCDLTGNCFVDLRLQRRLRIHRQIQFLFRLLCRTFLAGTTKIFSVAHIHIYVMCFCNRILQFR